MGCSHYRVMLPLLVSLLLLAPAVEVRAADTAGNGGAGADKFADRIRLKEGQSRVLSMSGVSHVAVGNGEILQVEVLDRTDDVLLIGLRRGVTDVRVWQGDSGSRRYRVSVTPGDEIDPERPSLDELQQLIGMHGDDESGLSIVPAADSLNIFGRARTAEQVTRIEALAARFDSVHSYIESPDIEQRDTVFIEARFIEVSESGLEQIGFDWDESIQGPTFAFAGDEITNDLFRAPFEGLSDVDQSAWPLDIGSSNTHLGWGFRLQSLVNLLVEEGQARVLAEPVLSALSGEEADFLSGGEIPVPVQDTDGDIKTDFREFGIELHVRPTTSDSREIRTVVEVEVSDVDFSRSVLGIPSFTTSRASTVMFAPSGRPLVIAGLINEETMRTVSKLPFLGDLPILGELFKSRHVEGERNELIIIVTPHVAGHGSRVNRSLLQHYGELVDRHDGGSRFEIME